jgi:hypothetical protein
VPSESYLITFAFGGRYRELRRRSSAARGRERMTSMEGKHARLALFLINCPLVIQRLCFKGKGPVFQDTQEAVGSGNPARVLGG